MTMSDSGGEARNRRLLVYLLLFVGGLFAFSVLYIALR